MITKIQIGHPKEIKEKRISRIKEGLSFPFGTREEPAHNIIDNVDGFDVYFDKPGKEYFRQNNQNVNDMAPGVGNLYIRYSFSDVWKDLLNLGVRLPDKLYKKLYVIIYRLAYMLDCEDFDGNSHFRFRPNSAIIQEIQDIQEAINQKKYEFNVLTFLYFLDILAWQEDVKYQSDCSFKKPRKGRINNLLSMISIPVIFKQFVDEVIENKDNLTELDYSHLIDVSQQFARTRGVSPLSNIKLASFLFPYLEK